MASEKKLESDLAFRLMTLTYKLRDLFQNPPRSLGKAGLFKITVMLRFCLSICCEYRYLISYPVKHCNSCSLTRYPEGVLNAFRE